MSRSMRLRAAAVALAVSAALSGCASAAADAVIVVAEPETGTVWPEIIQYPGVRVVSDVSYAVVDGIDLRADVCLPPAVAAGNVAQPVDAADPGPAATVARAAVISLHGGSWARGDKAEPHWRNVCEWLASEGFVGVSANYRLAPQSPFPAALDDARALVRWIREPGQLDEYGIDAARIGALGGSAGANLVALLGTTGDGPLDRGDRVAAVASLSGPYDLTSDGRRLGGLTTAFEGVQLDYLDCAALAQCPAARDASPLYQVDAGDPPFFVAHSREEMIPLPQGSAFVEALRASGVDAQYDVLDGNRHSIGMLDPQLYEHLATFLHGALDLAGPAA